MIRNTVEYADWKSIVTEKNLQYQHIIAMVGADTQYQLFAIDANMSYECVIYTVEDITNYDENYLANSNQVMGGLKDSDGHNITSSDIGGGKRALDVNVSTSTGTTSTVIVRDATNPNYKLAVTSTGAINTVGTTTSTRPTEVITSGTITSTGGTFIVHLDGYQSCAFVLSGTWTATMILEASSDNELTWVQSSFHKTGGVLSQLGIGIPEIVLTATINGTYKTNATGGVTCLRLRATSHTSGTVTINAITSESTDMFRFTQSSIVQNVLTSTNNSSTTNIAAGSQFIGLADSTLGIAAIQINFICDQPCHVYIQQSMDGTNWDIEDAIHVPINTARGRTYQATASYVRIIVTNEGGQTTSYLRLQTMLLPIGEPLPRALTGEGNLKVALMEKNPHTQEGSIDKWHVQDIEVRQLLEQILEELKTMNIYFEIMTDENVRNYDVIDSD